MDFLISDKSLEQYTMEMVRVRYVHETWVTEVSVNGVAFTRSIRRISRIIPGAVVNPPFWSCAFYLEKHECGILERYFYRDIVPLFGEPGNVEVVDG